MKRPAVCRVSSRSISKMWCASASTRCGPAACSIWKRKKSGSIVTVTSISGFQGLPAAHTYTAAKRAAINLTRSIAITYCNDGIRANCKPRDSSRLRWRTVFEPVRRSGDGRQTSPNEAPGDSRGDGLWLLVLCFRRIDILSGFGTDDRRRHDRPPKKRWGVPFSSPDQKAAVAGSGPTRPAAIRASMRRISSSSRREASAPSSPSGARAAPFSE